MEAGSSGKYDLPPRGTKRPSNSPQHLLQPRKAPRTSSDGGMALAPCETGSSQKRSQREQVRLNQLQEDEKSRQWVAQEDEFVLKQMKNKAVIRVKDDRARPIDWIAVILQMIDPTRGSLDEELDDPDICIVDPNTILDKSSQDQILELENEIDQFLSLETNPRNKDYWRTMKTICLDRRKKATVNPGDRAVSSVSSDIDRLLSPKSYEELEVLEGQINRKLESNEPIDADYWEQLHNNLLVWKARAKLKKIHQSVLESRMASSHQRADHATGDLSQKHDGVKDSQNNSEAPSNTMDFSARRSQDIKQGDETKAAQSVEPVKPLGRFAQTPNEDFSQATRSLYEKEVARGIGENEEIFAGEEDVETKSKPLWSGKYRPRKPRYFNRVQTGYEWNKYNQTHYDHDNPPPKVVQGYKFNVFYPDLIDKLKAPTYRIERQGGRKKGQSFAPAGEEDTCLIRFMSGPPYEDIAFHIVDKEWDYSAKRERGFKSSFDKGILQLHFQFKKVFYRK